MGRIRAGSGKKSGEIIPAFHTDEWLSFPYVHNEGKGN